MNSSIDFHLSFIEPQAHYVEVEMHIRGICPSFLEVRLPVWTPGSYLIREYARNIERVSAKTSNLNALKIYKINKNTWKIENPSEDFTISYRIYCFERSVRTNFVDYTHAFLSPAGTFLNIDGFLDHPVNIHINLPENWSTISTGLSKIEGHTNAYLAENFDILYDSPIEIGNQEVWEFHAAGVPHEFAMVGKGNYDKERLSEDVAKIIEEETKLWGSNPNNRYVFITHNYQNAHGGLEHLNSTVLAAPRNSYTNPSGYVNYLSLVAHEYFHLWHVKRLRPKNLGPFDYNQENYTHLLWIFEGFTAYYDNLITRRCGFLDEQDYLQSLVSEFNLVLNKPGHQVQSVGLSSFDTWIKHYRPDENSSNASISYYNKGAMLACMLDISILSQTNGKKRLDEVLQAAYKQFYLIENRGIEEEEFKELAEKVTGTNLTEIFDAVYSTQEIDYNAYFELVGYCFIDQNSFNQTPSLGIRIGHNDNKTVITGIDRDSAAWQYGLNVDDEIIGINGVRVDSQAKEIDYLINSATIGDKVDLLISRDGLLQEIELFLKANKRVSYAIERNDNATSKQRELGNIWLSLN